MRENTSSNAAAGWEGGLTDFWWEGLASRGAPGAGERCVGMEPFWAAWLGVRVCVDRECEWDGTKGACEAG